MELVARLLSCLVLGCEQKLRKMRTLVNRRINLLIFLANKINTLQDRLRKNTTFVNRRIF